MRSSCNDKFLAKGCSHIAFHMFASTCSVLAVWSATVPPTPTFFLKRKSLVHVPVHYVVHLSKSLHQSYQQVCAPYCASTAPHCIGSSRHPALLTHMWSTFFNLLDFSCNAIYLCRHRLAFLFPQLFARSPTRNRSTKLDDATFVLRPSS